MILNQIEYIISKAIKKCQFRAIKNSNIHKSSKICAGCHLVDVTINKHTDIGYNCSIYNTQIGSFSSFGSGIIVGGANHTSEWVSTSPVFNKNKDHLPQKFAYHSFFPSPKKTHIGNDVWIANNVIIKGGVNIGDGVIIGTGSVVTKDISPYEIWAGNPAKLIKKRFAENVILELLELKWWQWEDCRITHYARYFNDVNLFLQKTKNQI